MFRLALAVLLSLLASCNTLGPSGSTSFTEVLIRYELSVPASYMASNVEQQPFFVTVEGKDLTSTSIGRLSDTGIEFRPGSNWRKGEGMQMSISAPTLRPDGDFDVTQSYYCHERCSASIASVMRLQSGNWDSHILGIAVNLWAGCAQQFIKDEATSRLSIIQSLARRVGLSPPLFDPINNKLTDGDGGPRPILRVPFVIPAKAGIQRLQAIKAKGAGFPPSRE